MEFVDDNCLENLNVTRADGRVTWAARGQQSAIDFVLSNRLASEHVSNMWIDEEGVYDISTDHNMIVVEYTAKTTSYRQMTTKDKQSWKLKEADWHAFQSKLSSLELNLDGLVSETSRSFISNVIATGEESI